MVEGSEKIDIYTNKRYYELLKELLFATRYEEFNKRSYVLVYDGKEINKGVLEIDAVFDKK